MVCCRIFYSAVGSIFARCFFIRDLFLFSSSRFCFAFSGIFVFFLGGFFFRASFIKSVSLSTAALRFAFWVRNFCETTLITPFLSALVASLVRMRFFCGCERALLLVTLNRTVTRVLTLLTFCPPGPELRLKVKSSSSSLINIPF